MSRLALAFVVLSLSLATAVSGCAVNLIEDTRSEAPLAEMDATPSSYVATKVEDISGFWDHAYMGSNVVINFAEGGVLTYYLGLPPRPQEFGKYWFEGEELHFVESITGLAVEAIYSVTVELEDGESVHLSFTAIEDTDLWRRRDFEKGLTRTERPVGP